MVGLRLSSNVSLEINRGEILGLIGPNGAGKTCVINCISGFYRPQRGRIFLGDREIPPVPSYKVAELGISRTFQNIEIIHRDDWSGGGKSYREIKHYKRKKRWLS